MKLIVLLVYFAVLIGIGLYCRRHATDVNGFLASLPRGLALAMRWSVRCSLGSFSDAARAS